MKKTLALILAVLMCVSTLALVACGDKGDTTTAPSTTDQQKPSKPNKPHKPTPDNTPTDDDGKTPADLFSPLDLVPRYPYEEHEVKKDLPSSVTLVGTDSLPAVDNQGSVGSCASQAITHMQFTNACIRYEKSINPGSTWTAKDYADCFSPKFTYQYAGAITHGVYDVLRDHGCLKNSVDGFAKHLGASIFQDKNGYIKKTVGWLTNQGIGEQAMEYRLLRYEQIFVTNKDSDYYDSEKGVMFTTSDAGKALLQKIKDAVAAGNVVVTGGPSEAWKYERLRSSTGTLGKSGDMVLYCSTGEPKGGHQVSIVGYDDEFEFKSHGATMTGAFIVANSWGDWMKANGHKGYVWVPYDAVNTVSADEGFTLPEDVKRVPSLDQFCFTYWDRDIVKGLPDMYAELEIESTDRDQFKVELTRIDRNGKVATINPALFLHQGTHPDHDLANGYFNINGTPNGEAATGFHTVSFQRLLSSLPSGSSYEDYRWGIKINNRHKEFPITVKSITIKNAKGEVLHEVKLATPDTFTHTSHTYTFDFGKEKLQTNVLSGENIFMNVQTGKYLAKNRPMDFKVDDESKALDFTIKYDSKTKKYNVFRHDEKYVLDVKDTLTTGAPVVFNAQKGDREATQLWNVSYNDDGTVSLYITSAKGTNYAIGVADDGTVCIFKAMELTDNIKWIVESDEIKPSATTAKVTDKGVVIDGYAAGKSYKGVTIEAMNVATGKIDKTVKTEIKDLKFSATLELAKGTYVIRFWRDTDPNTAITAFCVVTVK